MHKVLFSIALVLAVEGLALAMFPDAMRVILARMALEPREALRRGGLAAACLGVAGLWLLH